jgi:molybdopterin-binding protein
MKLSARNVLKGTIKAIKHGVVTTEVDVELPNGMMVVSTITKAAADDLALTEGKQVYAVIKASNVMLAID